MLLHNEALVQSHAKGAYGDMPGHMLMLIHKFPQMKREGFTRPCAASSEHERLHVLTFSSVMGSTDPMVSFPKRRLQMVNSTLTRPQNFCDLVEH